MSPAAATDGRIRWKTRCVSKPVSEDSPRVPVHAPFKKTKKEIRRIKKEKFTMRPTIPTRPLIRQFNHSSISRGSQLKSPKTVFKVILFFTKSKSHAGPEKRTGRRRAVEIVAETPAWNREMVLKGCAWANTFGELPLIPNAPRG